MSRFVDLVHQVTGALGWWNGGTGNKRGYATSVVESVTNWSTTTDLVVGTLVRLRNGTMVEPTTTLNEEDVFGVVVGYWDGGNQDALVEDDCPPGHRAAVMTKGRTRVLIGADVIEGDYAFAHSTDGTAYSDPTIDAGAFGIFLANGLTSILAICPIELWGTPVFSAGGSGGTFGTPALTFSTTDAAGSIDEVIRRDATIAVFSATAPTTQAFGDAAAAGTAGHAARRDHKHGWPSLGNVTAQTGYGAASSNGSASSPSRSDHLHGTVDGKAEIEVEFITPTAGQVSRAIRAPYACTITGWVIAADASGSCVIDIWKDTLANFPPTVADTITASAKPTLSAARTASSSSLTGWTTSVAAGDWLIFKVDSASSITEVVVVLTVTRT